ncbi:MAG: hypothetical protein QOI98_1767 [Solirubrobacteraceae bacterium]|nr:hypothetical protein [Solirubrobacteraceae bacterium]
MLTRLRARLTYANVVATLALFIAVGGTAYAAATITGEDVVDKSLTGADIAADTLGTMKLKNDAITTPKLANRAVTASKLNSIVHRFKEITIPGGAANNGSWYTRSENIDCHEGERMIGGGAAWYPVADDQALAVVHSYPSGNGWVGRGANDSGLSKFFQVHVLCLLEGSP